VDLPGNGRQHLVKSPLKISEYTDFVRAEWLRTRPEGPCGIIGISLGGMVALDWASRFTDFQHATIINSSSSTGTKIHERLRLQSWIGILGVAFSVGIAAREQEILRLTVNDEKMVDAYAPRWADFGKQFPLQRLNLFRQLLAAARFHPEPIEKCRLLFVRAAGDRLVSPACSAALSRFYDGKLLTHAAAGHDLPLEEPQWLSDQIVKDLTESSLLSPRK
jgi:pimeloyl-ACP methyl ester carboxylesterase